MVVGTNASLSTIEIALNCGVYRKSEIKRALVYILEKKEISTHHFKFVIDIQKKCLFKRLVFKILFKFKPFFDISCIYEVNDNKEKNTFEYKSYSYEDLCKAFSLYQTNDSYSAFVENFDYVFNKGYQMVSHKNQNLAEDLLSLIKKFEERSYTKYAFKKIKVKDSLMFFIRYKNFNDVLRFQIFQIFGKGNLNLELSGAIFEAERKWKEWKLEKFQNSDLNRYIEVRKTNYPVYEKKKDSSYEAKESTLKEFLNKDVSFELLSENSLSWYQKRVKHFELDSEQLKLNAD